MFQSKIIFGKLVFFPQGGGEVIFLRLLNLEGFRHCPGNCFVSQALCLAVNRLHGVHQTRIGFRPVNLRLLHRQPSPFSDKPSPENEMLPRLQGPPQIRHIIPCQRQNSADVADSHGGHLEMAEFYNVRRLGQHTGYGGHCLREKL